MKTTKLAVALVMLILASSTAVIAAESESQADRPNIVFVLIDDLVGTEPQAMATN